MNRSAVFMIVVGAMVGAVSGCGSGAGGTLRSPGTDAPTTTTVAATTTTLPAATTTVATTTTAATTTTLPGEAFDSRHVAGSVLDVAGVAFDETLAVHALPGVDQAVVASLPPLTRGLVATGRSQLIETAPRGIWQEVTVDGVTGWVDLRYLVYLAAARDVTAEVAPGGPTPTASSMLDLGQLVTDALVPTEPDSLPRIVLAAAPGDGPTAVAIYDTFPGEAFGDDAAVGSRLVVTGRRVPTATLPATGFASQVGYELVSVDSIGLCSRGVTDDGLCV